MAAPDGEPEGLPGVQEPDVEEIPNRSRAHYAVARTFRFPTEL